MSSESSVPKFWQHLQHLYFGKYLELVSKFSSVRKFSVSLVYPLRNITESWPTEKYLKINQESTIFFFQTKTCSLFVGYNSSLGNTNSTHFSSFWWLSYRNNRISQFHLRWARVNQFQFINKRPNFDYEKKNQTTSRLWSSVPIYLNYDLSQCYLPLPAMTDWLEANKHKKKSKNKNINTIF
jgi:hypothetical protein